MVSLSNTHTHTPHHIYFIHIYSHLDPYLMRNIEKTTPQKKVKIIYPQAAAANK